MSLELMKKLASHPFAGPAPFFSITHIVKAIMVIGNSPGLGRKRLAEQLEIGEGSVRTMLQRLQEAGIMRISRGGCRLTRVGEDLYNTISSAIQGPVELDVGTVWEFPYTAAVLVRGAAKSVRKGIEQRDAAIREGAKGAMTIVLLDGHLQMPGVSDVSSEHPDFAERLLRSLNIREGDVVILAGANSRSKAERGAIAAALVTLGLKDE